MTTRAARLHRPHQGARARVEGDAAEHLGNHARGQAGEQRHPLAQRRFKRDLAAHRPLGDGRDAGADAGAGREFVDAFLTDEGRIRVGDQQALFAPRERLHDDVERLVREGRFERGALRFDFAGEVRGRRLIQPVPALDGAERCCGLVEGLLGQPLPRRIGY